MAEHAVVLAGIAVVCLVAAVFVGAAIQGRFQSTNTPTPAGPFEPPPTRAMPKPNSPTAIAECEDGGWRNFPSSTAKPSAGATSTASRRSRAVTPSAATNYPHSMRTIATGRLNQAAAKVGEHAPMATACCNTCRTCMQTNAIALALATVIGAGAWIAKLFRRSTAA